MREDHAICTMGEGDLRFIRFTNEISIRRGRDIDSTRPECGGDTVVHVFVKMEANRHS